MSRSSRSVAAGVAIVVLAAGAYTGWPREARADAPPGAETAAPEPLPAGAPIVLDAPVYFAPGHRLHVELPARTGARRDVLRVQADFVTTDGAGVGAQRFVARLTGGDWRTIPFQLDVPDGAVAVELTWSAVAGPVEVAQPRITSISSTAAQPPDPR